MTFTYDFHFALQTKVGDKGKQTSSKILGSTLILSYISLGIWAVLFIVAVIVDFTFWRPKRKALQKQQEQEQAKTPVQGTGDIADLGQGQHQDIPRGLPTFTGFSPGAPGMSASMAHI